MQPALTEPPLSLTRQVPSAQGAPGRWSALLFVLFRPAPDPTAGFRSKIPTYYTRSSEFYDLPMSETPPHWTVRHFSQANPTGPGCDSVPALLRRLADSIEASGPVEVQHLVIESELTEHGPCWSGTVYFHPAEDD
jgi:hypothetical protein